MSNGNGCRVRVRRVGADFVGHLTIHAPEVGSVITVAGWGSSMTRALRRASQVAKRISNDPVMSALIPPQARAAIAAADKLSAAAEQGGPAIDRALSQFSGPGAERLGIALSKMNGAQAEVGFLPIALLAAKYGPGIAKAASKAYKAKKARARKAKLAKRAAASPRAPQYAANPPPPPRYADEGDNTDEGYDEGDDQDNDLGDVEGVFSGLKRAVKFAVNPIAHTRATFRAARGVARKARGKRRAPARAPEPQYDEGDQGDEQGDDYEGEG